MVQNRKRRDSQLLHSPWKDQIAKDEDFCEIDLKTRLPSASMPRWASGRISFVQRHYKIILVILVALIIESCHHMLSNGVPRPKVSLDPPFSVGCRPPGPVAPRENATILMLARNEELLGAVKSIRSLESKFNRHHHYPVVFLNNLPWSDEFQKRLKAEVSGEAIFETISASDWGFSPGTDIDEARSAMDRQERNGIKYGGLENYHHMCRFNSGRFYDHPALQKYRWYWRVEPDVEFTCSITYDPFAEMIKNKKRYGYVMALWELRDTCPSLFRHFSDYRTAKQSTSPSKYSSKQWNAMLTMSWLPWPLRSILKFLPHHDEAGDYWNMCHFWTNFEIADMEFFRSQEYRDLFSSLDASGNFYNERWGDAPVHSLAVSMLLEPHELHHFSDFGYVHDAFQHCPNNAADAQLPNVEIEETSLGAWDEEKEKGTGCRCRCDKEKSTVQNYCLNKVRRAVDPHPIRK